MGRWHRGALGSEDGAGACWELEDPGGACSRQREQTVWGSERSDGEFGWVWVAQGASDVGDSAPDKVCGPNQEGLNVHTKRQDLLWDPRCPGVT